MKDANASDLGPHLSWTMFLWQNLYADISNPQEWSAQRLQGACISVCPLWFFGPLTMIFLLMCSGCHVSALALSQVSLGRKETV